MTSRRRVHNQPPRDDFAVHEDLGAATVRTDHPDGTATFAVQVSVPGHPGLHLNTGRTITRATDGTYTSSAAAGVFADLGDALTAVTKTLPDLTEPSAA